MQLQPLILKYFSFDIVYQLLYGPHPRVRGLVWYSLAGMHDYGLGYGDQPSDIIMIQAYSRLHYSCHTVREYAVALWVRYE